MGRLLFNEARHLSVTPTQPLDPEVGDPVIYGNLVGFALTEKGSEIPDELTVDFGPAVWLHSVTAASGDVSPGDLLYISSDAAVISNDSAGLQFGVAMGYVSHHATLEIPIRIN